MKREMDLETDTASYTQYAIRKILIINFFGS